MFRWFAWKKENTKEQRMSRNLPHEWRSFYMPWKCRIRALSSCSFIVTHVYDIHQYIQKKIRGLYQVGNITFFYHHHHHVPEWLGVFPVPWSSKWSWSLHLFFGRPMFLRPFGLYRNACFGILFLSILCTCCSHFFLVLFYFLYYVLCSCFFSKTLVPFFIQFCYS